MKKVFGGNKEFGESCNLFKSVVALSLSFGAIHFNVALILFALFFLPLSKALLFVFIILFYSFFLLLTQIFFPSLFYAGFQFACQDLFFAHTVCGSSCG
jgi:hypothetical protein